MKWEDLDVTHRNIVEDLGNFSPTVNIDYREVKGYMLDGNGDAGKVYFNSKDLREIAESCIAVANWLDLRAEQELNK